MPVPMLRSTLVAASLFIAPPAMAALSGWYDSAAKIGAILGDARIADLLRQAPVRSVENTGTTPDGHDEWTVRTQDCDLKVKVIAHPPEDGMVGMTTYGVEPIGSCD